MMQGFVTGNIIYDALAIGCAVAVVVTVEGKRAPEGWMCSRCAGEVKSSGDECPYCGERRTE